MILTPDFAVYAALMSSSAFFIEAAAKTVTVLSCATAGERPHPQDDEGGKNSGKTMHG